MPRGVVNAHQHLQDSLGEKYKPLGIVIEAVDTAALEVILVVHKVVLYALVLGLKEPAVLVAPGEGDIKMGDVPHGILQFLADVGIEGQDHPGKGGRPQCPPSR